MDEPSAAGIAAAFAHYEPYGIVPLRWMDQLRRVRERCPVVHSDACGGFWLVSRHDDVATILRTPAVFSSADGITIPHHPGAPVMPPIDLDPPLQAEFRQLLNPYFTAQAVRPYAPVIAALAARQLIDWFTAEGECELTSALARPLPALVLGRVVLGVEDHDALSELQSRVVVISGQNTSEEAAGAWRFLREYVTTIAAAGRSRPADGGLVSALVRGRVAGRPITEQEQVGTLMILILGELGTTADAISTIAVRLTRAKNLGACRNGHLDGGIEQSRLACAGFPENQQCRSTGPSQIEKRADRRQLAAAADQAPDRTGVRTVKLAH